MKQEPRTLTAFRLSAEEHDKLRELARMRGTSTPRDPSSGVTEPTALLPPAPVSCTTSIRARIEG